MSEFVHVCVVTCIKGNDWKRISKEIPTKYVHVFLLYRCVHLLAALSQLPSCVEKVSSLLPLMADATRHKEYSQHYNFLETVLKQVSDICWRACTYQQVSCSYTQLNVGYLKIVFSLVPRPHTFTRRNSLVNQVKLVELMHTFKFNSKNVNKNKNCSRLIKFTQVLTPTELFEVLYYWLAYIQTHAVTTVINLLNMTI